MAISSASTTAEIVNAYLDACDYDVTADVTKARTVVQALRMLSIRNPAELENGVHRVKMDFAHIQRLLSAAESWLADNDTSTSRAAAVVKFFSVEDFRS